MPVKSHGCPRESDFNFSKTTCGEVQSANIAPQPQESAIRRNMEKSASACPGALATFLIRPMRRSELISVPSFSPQPAAGKTRSARCAVSVVVYMS